jgi:hypothetical protein
VLLVVNLLAVFILFAGYLLFLLFIQSTTVRNAVVMNLLVDSRLVLVRASRFSGGFLAAAQTLRSARLLVGFAVVDLIRLDRISVVVFVVDLAARPILLRIDLLTLLTCELATVSLTL